MDRPGIEALATVERWLEVREVPERFRDPGLMEVFESRVVDLEVAPVTSLTSVGEPRTEPIDIHLPFFPGLDWALSNGGRAFLALEHLGDVEMAGYALVRTKEGEHFFPGQGGLRGPYPSRPGAARGADGRRPRPARGDDRRASDPRAAVRAGLADAEPPGDPQPRGRSEGAPALAGCRGARPGSP
ncbi:MAG: hypothetical protein KatS3mg014_1100 [Actinomycetota bacterium]|nr:MAG: hypothetical protein KatS3mg014_1100 [Actinomycetota bacterium]